jgi:hypothetical protein
MNADAEDLPLMTTQAVHSVILTVQISLARFEQGRRGRRDLYTPEKYPNRNKRLVMHR